MKYLWQDIDKITSLLKNGCPKVLLLDFDGTLTPIAKSPEKVKLSKEIKNILQRLSQKPNLFLAIISGRKLQDLKKKVKIPNIIYGGNHGLEGEIFGEKYVYPTKQSSLMAIESIKAQLNNLANQFNGVFVEDKGLTLSFHYRLAKKHLIPQILLLLKNILCPFITKGVISVTKGKKVFDVIPKVNWDKGHFASLTIKRITARVKTHPTAITIGDDTTDEDTFHTLKKEITIVVGQKSQSGAKYYFRSIAEVNKFLNYLLRTTTKNSLPKNISPKNFLNNNSKSSIIRT